MPDVTIRMYEGRTMDQKRLLLEKVTTAVCEAIDCKPEAVTCYIEEMKKEHHSRAGILASDRK